MNLFVESVGLSLASCSVTAVYVIPAIVLLCALLLYVVRWRDYLLPQRIAAKNADENLNDIPEQDWPRLSVIVPSNDQAELLLKNLPKILEQDYPNFEVIVVDEASTDETEEVIKQLQLKYRNLRRTFVPASSDICRRKFSITLGVRATRSEWSVITNASASPVSSLWLKSLAAEIDDDTDVILGYGTYTDDGTSYSARVIFEHLWMQLRCFRSAVSAKAIGGDKTNFCVRKSAFLANKGYADNLQNDFGESHLLIQTLSEKGNTKVVVSKDATMTEELPLQLVWRNMEVYYRETLRQSSRTTRWYLLREGFASLLVYLLTLCPFVYLAFRLLQILLYHDFTLYYFYLDVVLLLLIVAVVALPIRMLRKCTDLLDAPLYRWRLIGYALIRPFHNLSLKHRRWTLRKDFIRS